MTDIYAPILIAVLSALGGILIRRDLYALLIYTVLVSVAGFLTAFLLNASTALLGLLGLSTAAYRVVKISRLRGFTIKVYRSRRRLQELEEMTHNLARVNILDVVPAGSRRALHPKIVEMIDVAERAYSLGYRVEEPDWLRDARLYRRLLGSQFVPNEDVVVGETEVFPLEE